MWWYDIQAILDYQKHLIKISHREGILRDAVKMEGPAILSIVSQSRNIFLQSQLHTLCAEKRIFLQHCDDAENIFLAESSVLLISICLKLLYLFDKVKSPSVHWQHELVHTTALVKNVKIGHGPETVDPVHHWWRMWRSATAREQLILFTTGEECEDQRRPGNGWSRSPLVKGCTSPQCNTAVLQRCTHPCQTYWYWGSHVCPWGTGWLDFWWFSQFIYFSHNLYSHCPCFGEKCAEDTFPYHKGKRYQ